jgi:hypothetical protein
MPVEFGSTSHGLPGIADREQQIGINHPKLLVRFERYEGDTNSIPIGGRGRNESHDSAGIVAWIILVAVPQPGRTMSQF